LIQRIISIQNGNIKSRFIFLKKFKCNKIDNTVKIIRLIEIARLKYVLDGRSEEEIFEMTKNIFVYKLFSLESFNQK
jgi:hypothetical protein